MTKISIEKIKNNLPDGSQKRIAQAANTTPVSVSRAWNATIKWQIAESTKAVIELETKKLFLELYEGTWKEMAREIRKELRVSSH